MKKQILITAILMSTSLTACSSNPLLEKVTEEINTAVEKAVEVVNDVVPKGIGTKNSDGEEDGSAAEDGDGSENNDAAVKDGASENDKAAKKGASENGDSAEENGGAGNGAAENGNMEESAESGKAAAGRAKTAAKAGRKLLHPVVEEKRFNDYSAVGEVSSGVQLFCTAKSCTVGVREEEYPQLQAALDEYSQSEMSALEGMYHLLSQSGRKDFYAQQSGGEGFSPHSEESTITILLADDRVFSFIKETSSFSGGAHGGETTLGYNYDSQTGEQLGLSAVISDREALYEEIIARLAEDYGDADLFPEYKETVHQQVFDQAAGVGNYSYSLKFVLTHQGMTVYFNPYEIGPWTAGIVKVEIPYDNEKVGFNQKYICTYDTDVHKLNEYKSLSIDIDGDGSLEKVSYGLADKKDVMTFYTLTADGKEMTLDGYYGISVAYVMQGEDGVYFYGECRSDNDYRYLTIVNLESLAEGNGESSIYQSGFYDSVPMEAGNFELHNRTALLSTVPVIRDYRIGAGGMPVPLKEEYRIDRWELTALTDVPTFTGEGFAKKTVIPAGTKVYWVATDSETYGILEDSATGRSYKVFVDESTWPHNIEGKSVEECFDGVLFAG